MIPPGITRVRRETSTRLRGAELPACFVNATIAAAVRDVKRGRDARRLADKVRRIVGRE